MIYILENLREPRDLGGDIPFVSSARLDAFTITGTKVKNYTKQDGRERVLSIGQKHAHVSTENESFFVEDLGSLVGTFINGIKIGEDLSVIHPDWKERQYRKNAERIAQMNSGRLEVEIGCQIELGKEVFGNEAPSYRLSELAAPEIHPGIFDYGDIIQVKPDIKTETTYPLLKDESPKHNGDVGIIIHAYYANNEEYRVLFSDGNISMFKRDQLLLVPRIEEP